MAQCDSDADEDSDKKPQPAGRKLEKRVSLVSVASEACSVASSSRMPECNPSDVEEGQEYDLQLHRKLIQNLRKKKPIKKSAASAVSPCKKKNKRHRHTRHGE